MAGQSSTPKRSFAWLRVVLFNLVLVTLGVGGYFLYFKFQRESDLTDSTMRSLDRVVERIEQFARNGEQIGRFLRCESATQDTDRNSLSASPGFQRVILVLKNGKIVPPDGLGALSGHDLSGITAPIVFDETLYMPTPARTCPGEDDVIGVAVPVIDVLSMPTSTYAFDSLLLVRSDGQVVGQWPFPEGVPVTHPVELLVAATERLDYPRVSNLSQALLREHLARNRRLAGSPQPEALPGDQLAATSVAHIRLGDLPFRTFIQPLEDLRITDTLPALPGKQPPGGDQTEEGEDDTKREAPKSEAPEAEAPEAEEPKPNVVTEPEFQGLAIVGLIEDGRFVRTALSVGYLPLAVLLGIAILLIASLPLLRLFLTDRHLGVSRSFAWSVVAGSTTILLFTLYLLVLWGQERVHSRQLDEQVRITTELVRQEVHDALTGIGAMLIEHLIDIPGVDAEQADTLPEQRARCAAITQGLAPDQLLLYSFGLNAAGNEVPSHRVNCRRTNSEPLEVPDREYFRYWKSRGPPADSEPKFYVERIISYLSGVRTLVATTALPSRCSPDLKEPCVRAVVSEMPELGIASALHQRPTGIRFVLLRRDGQVVFHTFDDVSVVENWLRDVGSPSSLIGALQTNRPTTFLARYQAVPIRGYATPLIAPGDVTTFAPEMYLIGYVPTTDHGALQFLGAMTALPLLLLVAAGWTVIFIISTAAPGRRYDLVYPMAARTSAYLGIALSAAAGCVFWAAGAAAFTDILLWYPDVLLLGALAQTAWLCSRPSALFDHQAPDRDVQRPVYAAGSVLIAVVVLACLGPDFANASDRARSAAAVMTLAGGWIPLCAWLVGKWHARNRNAKHGYTQVAHSYLIMWLAVLLAMCVHAAGTYVVLTQIWEDHTDATYGTVFREMMARRVEEDLRQQRALLQDGVAEPEWFGRHLRRLGAKPAPEEASADIGRAPMSWFSRFGNTLPSVSASTGAARSHSLEDEPRASGYRFSELLGSAVVVAIILLAVFLTLRKIARRLFGLNVVFASHLAEAPFSARQSEQPQCVLYVESLLDPRVPFRSINRYVKCHHLHSLEQLEAAVPSRDTVLVLEGFEADIVDPGRRTRLIARLRQLIEDAQQPLLVIAPVLPNYWLNRHEDLLRAGEFMNHAESTQLQALLSHFTVVTGSASHPMLAPAIAQKADVDLSVLQNRGVRESELNALRTELNRCPRARHFVGALCNEIQYRIDNGRLDAAAVDQTLIVQVLARAMEGEYQRFWSMSSPDEQAEMISIAEGGYPNFGDPQTTQSLMQRGLLTKVDGRMSLPCETFRHFVLTRSQYRVKELQAQRAQEGLWSAVLPSLLVIVGLILAFILASSSRAADLVLAAVAGFMALVPALNAFLALTARRTPRSE